VRQDRGRIERAWSVRNRSAEQAPRTLRNAPVDLALQRVAQIRARLRADFGRLVEGIAQNDNGMIFGGVTLVALLCVATEGLFTWIQRRLTSPGLAPAAVWMSRLQDVPAAARV